MLLLIPYALSLLMALLIYSLTRRQASARIRFGLYLVGAVLFLISCGSLLFFVPQKLQLNFWQIGVWNNSIPAFTLDEVGIIFALTLAVILFATAADRPIRASSPSDNPLHDEFLLIGLGYLGVLAANPITLIIIWTAFDSLRFYLEVRKLPDEAPANKAVIQMSARMAGSLLLLGSMLFTDRVGLQEDFSLVSEGQTIFVLLSIILRLELFPFSRLESNFNVHKEIFARLIPLATVYVLMVRSNTVALPNSWITFMLIICLASAIFTGISLLMSSEIKRSTFLWINGFSIFALVGIIISLPESTLSWSLVTLFGATALILHDDRNLVFQSLPLAIAVLALGFPYSPNWSGMLLYDQTPWMFLVLIFFLPQILLLFGTTNWTKQHNLSNLESPLWVTAARFFSQFLLLATWIMLGIWIISVFSVSPPIWPGIVIGMVMLGFVLLQYFNVFQISSVYQRFSLPHPNVSFIGVFFWNVYRYLRRAVYLFSSLLEGSGGILWSLIFVIVLFSFIFSVFL